MAPSTRIGAGPSPRSSNAIGVPSFDLTVSIAVSYIQPLPESRILYRW